MVVRLRALKPRTASLGLQVSFLPWGMEEIQRLCPQAVDGCIGHAVVADVAEPRCREGMADQGTGCCVVTLPCGTEINDGKTGRLTHDMTFSVWDVEMMTASRQAGRAGATGATLVVPVVCPMQSCLSAAC